MISDEIKAFLHGDVAVDEATLTKFSRDYSIFSVKPEVVVFPKDVGDVKALVKFVAAKKAAGEAISLTGRSAGTDMTGGPLSQSIIVSFTKYFNHIGAIEEGEAPTVRVEPGVYFRDLEKALAAKGLLYPAYTASKDLCALGGMINNNSGGEKTLAYGKTEDYVLELDVVLGDGELHTIQALGESQLNLKLAEPGLEGDIYRGIYGIVTTHEAEVMAAKPDVSKNSAGYYLWNVWNKSAQVFDLTKLLVGSQGTLGLVVGAKLKLVKIKPFSRLAVVFTHDLASVGDLVEELLKFHPESIESYDDKTTQVAVKLWPQVIGAMKGNVFRLMWQFLPEMMMVLRGGMPKMVILVEMSSDDERALENSLNDLRAGVEHFATTHEGIQVRVLKDAAEAEKYWTIRRQSFALLHGNMHGKDTAPFIDDFIVKPEYMPEFLPKVNAILDAYKKDLIYTIAGHPGNGNFHIIPLMNLKDARVRALIPEISEKIYKLVLEYHGSITAEHNDGLIRTPYLEEMYGPAIIKLFEDVKKTFDPLTIFNPGKKVGGSLQYSIDHIKASAE